MVQLTDKIWTMDVPSMAFGFMVNNYANESELIYMLSMSDISDDDNAEETLIAKPLPPGTWRFLFTTKDVKKIPNGIVECKIVEYDGKVQGTRFVNYTNPNQRTWFVNKKDSFNSLLRSKGLDDKNYALIEKLK